MPSDFQLRFARKPAWKSQSWTWLVEIFLFVVGSDWNDRNKIDLAFYPYIFYGCLWRGCTHAFSSSLLSPLSSSSALLWYPGHSFRQDVVCGSSASPKVIAAFCALLGEVKWDFCNLEHSGHYWPETSRCDAQNRWWDMQVCFPSLLWCIGLIRSETQTCWLGSSPCSAWVL